MELAGLGIHRGATGDFGRKDGLECFSFLRSREGTEFLHFKLNHVELLSLTVLDTEKGFRRKGFGTASCL